MLCIKCKLDLDTSFFEFRKDILKYRNTCKPCKNLRVRNNLKNPPIKVIQRINVDTQTANCVTCLSIKPLTEFDFRKDNNKYRTSCKVCRKQDNTEYNKLNREKRRLAAANDRKLNPEKCKLISKKSRQKHCEKRRQEVRQWRVLNLEKHKSIMKRWRLNNPTWSKEYRLKNVEKIRQQENLYFKKRYHEDAEYKLRRLFRSRFKACVSRYSRYSSFSYLGCTVQFFTEYLQTQFTSEMTWDNCGTYWHIDHIVPVSIADHTSEDELHVIWNYENLQPLEASANIRKSNKLDFNNPKTQIILDRLDQVRKKKNS